MLERVKDQTCELIERLIPITMHPLSNVIDDGGAGKIVKHNGREFDWEQLLKNTHIYNFYFILPEKESNAEKKYTKDVSLTIDEINGHTYFFRMPVIYSTWSTRLEMGVDWCWRDVF